MKRSETLDVSKQVIKDQDAQLTSWAEEYQELQAENDELRIANAELVEALKEIELEIAHDYVDGAIQIIIKVLAKHGGEK